MPYSDESFNWKKFYVLVLKFHDNSNQWLISRKCKTTGMTSRSGQQKEHVLSLNFLSRANPINQILSLKVQFCPKFNVRVLCQLRWWKNSNTKIK